MTYTEAWDMPVEIRKWWVERTNKAISASKGEGGEGHTDPHGNVHK